MVIGIQLSSVRALMQTKADMRASLRRFAETGFCAVQLQWHSPDIGAEEVAGALRDTGMYAVSVQDYTEQILQNPAYYLRLADACGFTDICVSGIPAGELSKDGIRRFAARLAPLLAQLRSEGRTLSFHPRWQELSDVDGKPALAWLLAESDASLRVLPDMNHVVRAGLEPLSFLRSLAGRADMLHCKDMTDAAREKSHLTPVGQGCIDWPPILAAAQEAGIRYAFAEQESWDGDPFDALAQSYRYLRALIR